MSDAERFRDTSMSDTGVSSDLGGGSSSSQGAGGVQESKEAVKETAQQTVQTAKEAAQQIATDTQEQVQEVVSQTTEQVTQTVSQVREQATTAFVEQRDRVVETINGLAEALRETGRNLSQRSDQPGVGAVSPFIDEAAERLSQSADFLREKDISGLVSEAQQLARRQPGVFLGAMFAVGIAGARLLKGAVGDDSGQSQSGSQGSTTGGSVGNSTSESGLGSGYGMTDDLSSGGSSGQSDYLLESAGISGGASMSGGGIASTGMDSFEADPLGSIGGQTSELGYSGLGGDDLTEDMSGTFGSTGAGDLQGGDQGLSGASGFGSGVGTSQFGDAGVGLDETLAGDQPFGGEGNRS